MNEPFDSSERQPRIDDGDPLPIEQQLQAFRPRATQLNWDEITASSVRPSSPTQSQVGYTARQMSLAIAASWILGAVIGGGSIFWSMPVRDGGEVKSGTAQTGVEVPQSPTTPLAGPSSELAQSNMPTFDAFSPTMIGLADMSWTTDEPLSARSLTTVITPGRLTSLRGTTLSNNSTSTSSNQSDEPSFTPTPISNRQQLMQQYCSPSALCRREHDWQLPK